MDPNADRTRVTIRHALGNVEAATDILRTTVVRLVAEGLHETPIALHIHEALNALTKASMQAGAFLDLAGAGGKGA